jgi:Cation efflux family
MSDAWLRPEFVRGVPESNRLLELRFVLLQSCSSVVEADEDNDRHFGRVLQLRVDDCRGIGFGRVRLDGGKPRSASLWSLSRASVLRFPREEITSRRTELFATGLLFALIPVISLGAVYSYVSGPGPEGSPLGIAIAIGAVIVMPHLWWEKRKIGEETRSLLSIDAVESITCLFMSVALLVGLLAEYFFALWWADYLATAVILVLVTREALESYSELLE